MKLLLTSIIILLTSFITVNSQNNGIELLDSVITYNGHGARLLKEEFEIDANNNAKQISGFTWDKNQWAKSYKIDFDYDNNGNLLSDIKTMIGGTEYIERKNIFSYDSNNNFLSVEYFLCNSSTQLIGIGKNVYTYNADHTIKEVVSSTWNAQTASWIESSRYTYEYDAKQNQTATEILKKGISSLKWEKESKIEKKFNASNILIEEATYKGVLNEWVKAYKTVTDLNADNTISKSTVYNNNGLNQWVNSIQYIYEYVSSKLSIISEYSWNGAIWVLNSKDEYSYVDNNPDVYTIKSSLKKENENWTPYLEKAIMNLNGGKTSEYYKITPQGSKVGISKNSEEVGLASIATENFIWDNNQWVSLQRNITFFNKNNRVEAIEKHNQSGEYYRAETQYTNDDRLFTENTFDWYQNDWALARRVQYFYPDTVTGIEEPQHNSTINVLVGYGVIKIESEEPVKNVKVYTMSGKLIFNDTTSEINTSLWDKGTAYIVSVTTSTGKHRAVKVLIK